MKQMSSTNIFYATIEKSFTKSRFKTINFFLNKCFLNNLIFKLYIYILSMGANKLYHGKINLTSTLVF